MYEGVCYSRDCEAGCIACDGTRCVLADVPSEHTVRGDSDYVDYVNYTCTGLRAEQGCIKCNPTTKEDCILCAWYAGLEARSWEYYDAPRACTTPGSQWIYLLVLGAIGCCVGWYINKS